MAKRYNKTAFIASYHQAFLSGHTAEQLAHDLGLTVNAVHSRAFYLREGGLKLPRLKRTRKLAAKPLSSLMETKRLMKTGHQAQVLAQMKEEGAVFGRMLTEPAAKEAFGAFMEKRKPDFSKV